jgi:Transposase IS200 like
MAGRPSALDVPFHADLGLVAQRRGGLLFRHHAPPNPTRRLPLRRRRVYGERKRNFVGQHFWARGFFVNTVGRDEEAIRAYIRNQEKEDQRLEQMNLWR